MSKTKLIGKGLKYYFGTLLLVVFLGTATSFITGHGQLFLKEYFGVWEQNVETKIYKETEMYNEGKAQTLAKLRLEYKQAKSQDEKDAIASTIRLRFADYEADRLPDQLANFLTKIRGY